MSNMQEETVHERLKHQQKHFIFMESYSLWCVRPSTFKNATLLCNVLSQVVIKLVLILYLVFVIELFARSYVCVTETIVFLAAVED